MRARSSSVIVALAVALGCGSREEKPPWERDAGRARSVASDRGESRDAGVPFRAETSRRLPPGTHEIDSNGFSARVEDEVVSMLETDLDGDGREDVLIATRPEPSTTDGGPQSVVLARISAYRMAPDRLALAAGREDSLEVLRLCDPNVVIRRASKRSIVIDATNDCPEEMLRTSGTFPVSSTPRARFRITLTGRLRDPGRVAIEPSDLDGDGREDLLVRVDLRTPYGDVTVPLRYLERAAGLTADPTEPEAALAEIVRESTQKRAGSPTDRRSRLRAVLHARELLCKGTVRDTRLAVGAGAPRRCEPSAAVGRAIAGLARAEIDLGDALAARRTLRLLASPGVRLGEEARTKLERAVREAAPPASASTLRGPSLDLAAIPRVRAGALRFLDDGRLLVGGRSILQLDTGAVEPAGEETDLRLVAPDGSAYVAALGDRCGEPVALVCPVSERCSLDDPSPRLVPLREPDTTPVPERDCPRVHPARAPRIVGWVDAGLLWVSASGTDLLATNPATGATVSRPPPFDPPPGGPFASRGRSAVLADPTGLWLVGPAGARPLDPEGISPPWETFEDLVVSDSGRVVAGVRDGVVFVFRVAAPTAE